jgi:1-deoxy-D-xylulose-5-phosphate reductoisomerase
VGQLTFGKPDTEKYPCMGLAYAAGRAGGSMPAVLNAANEQAVALFLQERISFREIASLIEAVCDRHRGEWIPSPSLEDVLAVDAWARRITEEVASRAPRVPVASLPA